MWKLLASKIKILILIVSWEIQGNYLLRQIENGLKLNTFVYLNAFQPKSIRVLNKLWHKVAPSTDFLNLVHRSHSVYFSLLPGVHHHKKKKKEEASSVTRGDPSVTAVVLVSKSAQNNISGSLAVIVIQEESPLTSRRPACCLISHFTEASESRTLRAF